MRSCVCGLTSLKTKKQLLQEFKKNNSSWNLTQCMFNKDMIERNVLSEQFPQLKLLICFVSHTMHYTKRYPLKNMVFYREKGACF